MVDIWHIITCTLVAICFLLFLVVVDISQKQKEISTNQLDIMDTQKFILKQLLEDKKKVEE